MKRFLLAFSVSRLSIILEINKKTFHLRAAVKKKKVGRPYNLVMIIKVIFRCLLIAVMCFHFCLFCLGSQQIYTSNLKNISCKDCLHHNRLKIFLCVNHRDYPRRDSCNRTGYYKCIGIIWQLTKYLIYTQFCLKLKRYFLASFLQWKLICPDFRLTPEWGLV